MTDEKLRPRSDNPDWTDEDFARARPATYVHGGTIAGQLVRKGGRPPKPVDERKQQVTMRFAPDVLAALRASGPGWQARVEHVLRREFLGERAEHPVEASAVRYRESQDGGLKSAVREKGSARAGKTTHVEGITGDSATGRRRVAKTGLFGKLAGFAKKRA